MGSLRHKDPVNPQPWAVRPSRRKRGGGGRGVTAALFSHHHCCLLAGISTFLSQPCCCLSLGLWLQGENRVATPRDRIHVPGWRLPELKERAHQALAMWCWPQSPFKGIWVLEDGLAQNSSRPSSQCSRSLSSVATFLGFPSAAKACCFSLELPLPVP